MKQILVTVAGEYEELGWVALNQIGDAVFLTDHAGQIKFISPGVEPILGYTPAEVRAIGNISTLLGGDVLDGMELSAPGELRDIERVVLSKFGDERHLLIHVKAVSIKDCAYLYTCRDITDQRSAQQALRTTRLELAHASRLALAGHLMASIAHEINQPLTSIVSNADAALVALERDVASGGTTELPTILNDIREEGKRAADVVSRLRALVRRQPVRPQLLELRQFIEDTLRLIRGHIRRSRITLHTELASSLPRVEADPVSLQQVLLNVVLNAIEAMEEVHERPRELRITASSKHGLVEITVSDNAYGIEGDQLSRVFEPFFTTKPEGLGLGLAIAKSIIEEHGGSIGVESGTPSGATFRISLPGHVEF